MSLPTAQSSSTGAPTPPHRSQASLPDGPRVQDQLAALTEAGELRGWLDFLRALLNARAVALFPSAGRENAASVVVTTRGILASALAPIGERLAGSTAAIVEPAAELGEEGYTLAVPVRRDDQPVWVLLAQLVVPDARDLQAYLVILQTVAGYLLYREQRAATENLGWVLARTSGLLDLFRRAGAEEDYQKAVRIAVDGLREYLGCRRVIYSKEDRLRAISGVQRVDAKSPAHQPVETALREAILHGERVNFPADQKAIAHQLLAEHTGAAQIVTLPLPEENGALLLEWETEPDARTPALLDAALPFAPPLFHLLERARPNPVVFFLRRTWRRATRNRRRTMIGALVALVAFLAFPFHYDIKCDCRLIPEVQRVVAAPFEGQLGRTRVLPGDRVQEGDLLIVLDNRELKLKEAEIIAARDKALKQRDRAMSSGEGGADLAAAQVAALEAESSGQELALVRRELSLLEVRAPLTGVVVTGDLRRAEGQPVHQGQPLFEIAPLESMLVEIAVPDREVSRIRAGQPVSFRLEARGSWSGESTLAKVYPQSETREGANIFLAEAPVKGSTDLRPGMKGRAVIESDRRPLVWQLTHRLAEWIETTLWW